MSLASQLPRALPLQTWMKKQSTMAVMHALSQKGGTAKFVGGCVRDTLAGKTEPDNFDIDIMHARSLLYNGQLDECIKVLKGTKVLPSEMARESRQLYEWVHLAKAIKLIEAGQVDQAKDHIETSREWPKHLGVGKPYDPDERLQNIIGVYLNG